MQGEAAAKNNNSQYPESNVVNVFFCHILSIAYGVYFRYETDEKAKNNAGFYRWVYKGQWL